MEVFLIPAGERRYQLYCEVSDANPAAGEGSAAGSGGWRHTLFSRFTAFIVRVEEARHDAAARRAARAPRRVGRRLKDRVICWLAEKIAEQRLLWHLRGHHEAVLWFPDDLQQDEATGEQTRILKQDARRHLVWLLPDGLLMLVCVLLLTPIPGPNLLGFYFTFRVAGHALSWLGARHGLRHVRWTRRPSDALTEVRQAIGLDPEGRRRHVADIASRLRLQHLASFLDRIAVPVP